MMQQLQEDMQSTDRTPPMQPGPLGQRTYQNNWPTVLGVVLIVFGAGGMLAGMGGIFGPMIQEWAASLAPQAQAQLEVTTKWRTWTVVSSAGALLIATLLLCSGIFLARRARHSVWMLRVWGLIKMVYAAFAAVLGYQMQKEAVEALLSDPSAMGGAPPFAPSLFHAIGWIGIAIGVAWAWALPVFVLIWFGRARIRRQIAEWS